MQYARICGVVLAVLVGACSTELSVGDPSPTSGGDQSAPSGTPPADAPTIQEEPVWEWLNPKPTAQTFLGIGGTGSDDMWIVGEGGTVLHWDGTTITAPYESGRQTDTFWAVYASARDDVWIAGKGSGSGSRVLHYDGARWDEDFTLTSSAVHALWGTDRDDVWAATDQGGRAAMQHWDGSKWSAPGEPTLPNMIRAVHGVDRDHAWAVGEGGLVLELDANHRWKEVGTPASVTPGAPVTELRDPRCRYIGVVAKSASDVWAACQSTEFVSNDGWATLMMHFDGSSWQVRGTIKTNGTSLAEGRKLEAAADGSLMIVGELGHQYVLSAQATNWVAVPTTHDFSGLFGGSHGEFYAAGYYGTFARLDPQHVENGLRDVFPTTLRQDLVAVAPVGDQAWATDAFGSLWRWTGTSWESEQASQDQCNVDHLFDVFALGVDDAWAVGKRGAGLPTIEGVVCRIDHGRVTSVSPLGMMSVIGVWAAASNDAWIIGYDPASGGSKLAVAHWDGASWTRIAVPAGVPLMTESASAKIWGRATDEVWISVNAYATDGSGMKSSLLRWDGGALSLAFAPGAIPNAGSGVGRPFAFSATDVWLPEAPALRLDGERFQPLPAAGDFASTAIAGTRPDRVWLVGDAIRLWDGHALTTALRTSARITDVRVSPAGDVWAVGQGGATLRVHWRPKSNLH